MRTTCLIGCLLVFLSGAPGCDKEDPTAVEKAAPTEVSLNDLPPVLHDSGEKYRVDPYLQAAVSLQAMDSERALKNLKALAERDDDARVIVLCRMLFAELRPGTVFSRPVLGSPHFVGGEPDWNDRVHRGWPLEPIELVDGVPFLVVRGYVLGGKGVSSWGYLAYCIQNCGWSQYRYKPKSLDEKKAALKTFLSLPKVKGRLDDADIRLLETQLR